MKRIDFDIDFPAQRKLQVDVHTKHVADGASSPLNPFITANEIDFTADLAAGALAVTYDAAATLLGTQSSSKLIVRDNLFNPIWEFSLAWVQFLKKLYPKNVMLLGDWGIPVEVSGKIDYPASFDNRVAITLAIIAKSISYPLLTSPLLTYLTAHSEDLIVISANIVLAKAAQADAKSLVTQSEAKLGLRDNTWALPFKNIKGMGYFLLALYDTNEKEVSAWGYKVISDSKEVKVRNSTVSASANMFMKSVPIGSHLQNTGTDNFNLYKGKTMTGTPILVKPGDVVGMTKGYSCIVIENTSLLAIAKFSLTPLAQM